MIPKVIHYCWFGGKKKSKLIKDCIKSWNRYLPDYEIIEWNEENSDLSHQFVKEAYKLKKWAFVSDYIRLKVLYDFGGVYLDTDMMVIKPFESLLDNKCFFGAEDLEFISCGIIGAERNHWFIKRSINHYNNFKFSNEMNLGMNTIPRIVTEILRKEFKYQNNFDELMAFADLTIFPPQYFYPFPFSESENVKEYKEYIKRDSLAIHLWNSSWIQYSEFTYLRKRQYKKGFRIALENIFSEKKVSLKYLRKIASCIKESINYKR
jgi:mannosyltransferase OCH1-like enzyme